MATPFNPFAGRGQRAGATGTPGRGRGSALNARSAPFQTKSSNTPQQSKFRGRGRGSGARSARGRGAAVSESTTSTSHTVTGQSTSGSVNSPFAQLNQKKSFSTLFGGQPAQQKPSFPGVTNGIATSNGANGTSKSLQANIMGGGIGRSVPVEDASVLNHYQERYEQLKVDRAKRRQKAIKDGQMADPNQPTSLNQAITPIGTCTSMCPEFESVERIVQKMVDKSEKFLHPSTGSLQNMESKMLKRFRRSAAGYDEQLPSDIRTPKTLLQATNYLTRHILGGSEPLGTIHKYVWDRTRSIRNDFSVQQLTQEADVRTAVTCLERIARFHIMSLHLLTNPANEEPFDRHQEREQLNNTMLSLMYYYDDNRGRITFRNEDEFRAYYIIFSIHDQRPDLEARVQKWPAAMLNSPRVQVALEIFAASSNTWEYQGALDARRPNAIAQGFYARFFNLINSPSVSYLMACVAEIYFNHMRQTAIRAIWKAYCRSPASQQHKNEEWTVKELTKVLHFDDDDQTIKFCEEQDLELAENAGGDLYLNWGNRPVDSVGFQPSSEHVFSDTFVESKRGGRTLVAIVLGLKIREAARMGMLDRSSLPEQITTPFSAESQTPTQDDSLFVSDEDNTTPAPVVEPNTSLLENVRPESPTPSNFGNIFGGATQPPSSTPSQSQNPFQPSEPSKTFGSLFSGTPTTSNPPASSSASPNPFATLASTTSSPFAPLPSPLAIPKEPEPAEKEETPATATPTQQPSSIFSGSSFSSTTAKPSAAPNPFAASLSSFSSFKAPGPSQQEAVSVSTSTVQQTPPVASNPFAASLSALTPPKAPVSTPTVQQTPSVASKPFTASFSPFTPPKAPSPLQQVEYATESKPEQAPSLFPTLPASAASVEPKETSSSTTLSPQFGLPTTSQPTSLFNFSSPPSASQPEQTAPSAGVALGSSQQSASLFSSVNAPSFVGVSQAPLFASPQATTTDEEKPAQDSSVTEPAQPVFSEPKPAPKLFDTAPTTPAFGTLFQPATPLDLSGSTPTVQQESSLSPESLDGSTEVSKSKTTALNGTPAANNVDGPLLPSQTVTTEPTTKPDGTTEQMVHVDSTTTSEPPSESRGPPTSASLPTSPDMSEERHRAWVDLLNRAAMRRRYTQASSRKRMYEEPIETGPTENGPGPKAAKVAEGKGPSPPVKFSMARSSIKPLPTLPILERVKALTERKRPSEEEIEEARPKSTQVDEDEMLLSAARIAAESLRSGPKLSDGWSEYGEPRGSSFSPSSSVSSMHFARSASPPQSFSQSYNVAYAPDTPLGLGRTMSRTEQRIRTTGGHGLAYKPLNFTPDGEPKFTRSR